MRPKVRVFERHRVHFKGTHYPPYAASGEGFFAEISWETEVKVGETEPQAVERALQELQSGLTQGRIGAIIRADSLEDRLRRVTQGA